MDTARSTAGAVADRVTDAASQVGAAAWGAIGTASVGESSTDTPKSVYVGNLFFDVKEDDLRREFSKAGNVLSVRIIYDQRGLSKG